MTNSNARNTSGDDWKTPDDFYRRLDSIYHFDFDPCPYQAEFDGLKTEWGGGKLRKPAIYQKAERSLRPEGARGEPEGQVLRAIAAGKHFYGAFS